MNEQVISVIPYAGGGDLLTDARTIIDGARQYAYSAVNVALVQRNWLLGKRISEEELKEDGKANYGLEIVKNLSRKLTAEYGKGFSGTDLYWCVRFYKAYPEIFASLSKKSSPTLSWTHYRILLQVEDSKARDWYLHEASFHVLVKVSYPKHSAAILASSTKGRVLANDLCFCRRNNK